MSRTVMHKRGQAETRRFARIALSDEQEVWVRPLGSTEPRFECRAEEVSEGGCLVCGTLPDDAGDVLSLELELPQRRVFVTARIVRRMYTWGQPGKRLALEFLTEPHAECPACLAMFPFALRPNALGEGPRFCVECTNFRDDPIDIDEMGASD